MSRWNVLVFCVTLSTICLRGLVTNRLATTMGIVDSFLFAFLFLLLSQTTKSTLIVELVLNPQKITFDNSYTCLFVCDGEIHLLRNSTLIIEDRCSTSFTDSVWLNRYWDQSKDKKWRTQWDVFTHPWPIFHGGFVKPPLKLGHGTDWHAMNVITYPCPNRR